MADNNDDELTDRKRLAQVLRYVATIHQSADSARPEASFVRRHVTQHEVRDALRSDFFQSSHHQGGNTSVLFSTRDFQRIVRLHEKLVSEGGVLENSPAPFSFYAADMASSKGSSRSTSTFSLMSTNSSRLSGRKRKSPSKSGDNMHANQRRSQPDAWLRLKRMAIEQPPSRKSSAVRDYLRSWKESMEGDVNYSDLLTLESLGGCPKIAPSLPRRDQREIESFLSQYKKYLQREELRRAMEPLYDRLFEWLQGSRHDHELVWGLGNAKMRQNVGVDDDYDYDDESAGFGTGTSTVVNGPVLEVLVEVELGRDGALLVRPRPHTGVALHREVTAAINTANEATLTDLHRQVSTMETRELSPGQPGTYTKLLKQIALQMASGGTFVSSSSTMSSLDFTNLVLTDTGCLFERPKPSTVWARDASVLAEQVMKHTDVILPQASVAFTQGPDALDQLHRTPTSPSKRFLSWTKMGSNSFAEQQVKPPPLLPLPASDTQIRLAELLLQEDYPAVVLHGPPGTGKTHTIANVVCAYLARGKRVLVTSKGAPALSVLKERLPKSVQDLSVDVSMSETKGMRQLQQTVERLAEKVSCINSQVQKEHCDLLQNSMLQLETELKSIDDELEKKSEEKRLLVQSLEGRELFETGLGLVKDVPWLMKAVTYMDLREVQSLNDMAQSLLVPPGDPMARVTGFPIPPSRSLVTAVAAKAGETLASVKTSITDVLGSIPVLGKLSGYPERNDQVLAMMKALRINGMHPGGKTEWNIVLRTLRHETKLHEFRHAKLGSFMAMEEWEEEDVFDSGSRQVRKEFVEHLRRVARVKELAHQKQLEEDAQQAMENHQLDCRRRQIATQLQHLARELVEATVVSQLSDMFDSNAQSALIRFAQIAGRAKFSRSSQASKMSQRQKRHRQEYLEAFERCVRYIPCWILTSTQISDYLPSEFGLFDLVILDEASQSDVSVLPGMLRGQQWLIVGDGKQVSPTESFISEAQIERLRTVLPESPLEDALLPGRSFFDLCAQAFPRGRAVLKEHFRCAPEIIQFSNAQFYNGQLVPLRLPTTQERLSPSVIDVRVDGTKVGKTNEVECDKIVKMVKQFVVATTSDTFPRSIGVISFIGDEQSRLIRGRLLDAIGPQKYKEHDILVGEPPTFQGAERDIVFLSMVCSPSRVPTQSQVMHAQRINVALSRARDRMVLVRSIDVSHIPNDEDIKIPVIDFFASMATPEGAENCNSMMDYESPSVSETSRFAGGVLSFREQAQSLVEQKLESAGYQISRMGVIWENAICVESSDGAFRATIAMESVGEPKEHWRRLVRQQKSIERVGWSTMRLDAVSFLLDHSRMMKGVTSFLTTVGVHPDCETISRADENDVGDHGMDVDNDDEAKVENDNHEVREENNDESSPPVEVVSLSGEEKESEPAKLPQRNSSEPDEQVDPTQFGDVVGLDFLRGGAEDEESDLDEMVGDSKETKTVSRSSTGRQGEDSSYLGDEESVVDPTLLPPPRKKRRRRYKKKDKYSRDPRFYPGLTKSTEKDEEWFYDTDSDLSPSPGDGVKREKHAKRRQEQGNGDLGAGHKKEGEPEKQQQIQAQQNEATNEDSQQEQHQQQERQLPRDNAIEIHDSS